jgi:hypothetical protein
MTVYNLKVTPMSVQAKRHQRRKDKSESRVLPQPLPVTGSIVQAGKLFFDADKSKSYRLKNAGVIPTVRTGPRSERALLHVLARQLGVTGF